jgi:LemA protein
MVALYIILAIVFLLAIYVVSTYNSLINYRNRVKDGFASIDVLLKRRNDLIPNLVETVKGYATHEKETLAAVISARNSAVSAQTPHDKMTSSNELTNALGHLFAVAESYPDLKANTNFLDLQNSLRDTEDQISNARQTYNDLVLTYKNQLELFPSNIVAGMFHFQPEEFFAADEKDREVPKVQF